MTSITACREGLDALVALIGDGAAADLPARLGELDDDALVAVITHSTSVVSAADAVRIAAVGVVAQRSTRDRGHGGLAQKRGHRTTVSLLQELTGATRAEAATRVRIGESLIEGVAVDADPVTDRPEAAVSERPWHACLGDALLAGVLTAVQNDAIRRGLGEPPTGSDDAEARGARAAWHTAAEQLIEEASARTVEELRIAARTIRDLLDPEGAERRYDERFAQRSFRMWIDDDGVHRASIRFDDESALWVRTIIDSALRPRRGGPRFVDPAEAAAAEELVKDPRSNDQLTYDLMMDTIRAGSLADAEQVFGPRQAGVRVVVTAESLEHLRGDVASGVAAKAAVGHSEDGGRALPAWLIDQRICDVGESQVTLDRAGNPLYLGREQRLFSAKQKLALAVRDGGCRWRGCDRPSSYCEAHHIDPYVAQNGRTDVDRGILLCRFHHMQLHHGGWRITRDGTGDFVLHAPDGSAPVVLPPRLALTYAWAGIDPPPRRFVLAA